MTFVPLSIGNKDCTTQTPGSPDPQYHYILKATTGDTLYPPDACPLLYHSWFQVDRILLNTDITGAGLINIAGSITTASLVAAGGEVTSNGGTHILSVKKNFDIPHPTKEGWRLRHTCIEGPENAVFFRGTMRDTQYINLPDYWKELVNPESITVQLTQIGTSQDLIVEKIEYGRRIKVKSGNASTIHCHYLVQGTRKDGEDLIAEYEGETPADYPGNNDEYSISGYHYDVKEDKK
jgi:hypothetical protein